VSFSKLFEIEYHLQKENAVRELAKQGCGSLSKHWLGVWFGA
jgi:hypothetical protein